MKRLISTALVAALSLTTIAATPASALDRGQQKRLIIGLSALAIIGALASQSHGSTSNNYGYVDRNRPYDPDYDRYNRNGRDDRYNRDHPVYGPRDRHGSNSLPASCEFRINGRHGTQSVVGQSCLSQYNISTRHLPDACEFNIRTSRGTRAVYGSDCLVGRGYRIEARR